MRADIEHDCYQSNSCKRTILLDKLYRKLRIARVVEAEVDDTTLEDDASKIRMSPQRH